MGELRLSHEQAAPDTRTVEGASCDEVVEVPGPHRGARAAAGEPGAGRATARAAPTTRAVRARPPAPRRRPADARRSRWPGHRRRPARRGRRRHLRPHRRPRQPPDRRSRRRHRHRRPRRLRSSRPRLAERAAHGRPPDVAPRGGRQRGAGAGALVGSHGQPRRRPDGRPVARPRRPRPLVAAADVALPAQQFPAARGGGRRPLERLRAHRLSRLGLAPRRFRGAGLRPRHRGLDHGDRARGHQSAFGDPLLVERGRAAARRRRGRAPGSRWSSRPGSTRRSYDRQFITTTPLHTVADDTAAVGLGRAGTFP